MVNQKRNNFKNIFSDICINIIATILPVFLLQFIVLPLMANKCTNTEYGLILTLISMITLSVQSLSVSLTNTRLLMNQRYIEADLKGDFNLILFISSIGNIIFVSIGTYLYEGSFNTINVFFIIILSTIQLIRKYLEVSFRLDISYKKILWSNFLLGIGYLVGWIFFIYTDIWQLVYIAGEVISLIYIIRKSHLLKEPLKITHLFKDTVRQSSILLIASFLGTTITYIDRLLLYPILGPRMVTVYYVATLLGKTMSMVVTPINNVILTYLSKMTGFKKDSFKVIFSLSIFMGFCSYIGILLISKPVLNIMYPEYVHDAMKIIYITTLMAIFNMLSTIINPILMKFCDISWQMWINVINIVIYISLSIFLVNLFGIYGFCIGSLVASGVKLAFMILIYARISRKSRQCNNSLKVAKINKSHQHT